MTKHINNVMGQISIVLIFDYLNYPQRLLFIRRELFWRVGTVFVY